MIGRRWREREKRGGGGGREREREKRERDGVDDRDGARKIERDIGTERKIEGGGCERE